MNKQPEKYDNKELQDLRSEYRESGAVNAFSSYAVMSDEEIAISAKTDSFAQEYLLRKYKNFVRSRARSYFLIGADKEDVVQEGMIGLYKAIRDYDLDKRASFRGFAELCITRQMITAIKTATRQKHMPLNSYVSLNKPVYDEESERTLVDILTTTRMYNPEDIVIDKEDFSAIELEIAKILSELEKKVLTYYLRGASYMEIARIMERSEKSIDNALQRAKGKIDKFLNEKNTVV